MKNRNPIIVEIINDRKLLFKCKICGKVWYHMIRSGGRLVLGSWQCPYGCRPDKKEKANVDCLLTTKNNH